MHIMMEFCFSSSIHPLIYTLQKVTYEPFKRN